MALHLGSKINRIIKIEQLKNFKNILLYSNQSKPKYNKPYFKAASTLTQNKVKAENNAGPSSIPFIPSDMQNNEVTLRRKFAKSSTHNALTQPLKLPRLANPFPEPVKTLRSDTVSDEEKARLMEEQVKMEARFHLQMQQEQQLKKVENFQSYENKNEYEQQNPMYNSREIFNQPNQFHNLQNKQPKFKKPKSYDELAKEASEQLPMQNEQTREDTHTQQEKLKPPKKFALNFPNKSMGMSRSQSKDNKNSSEKKVSSNTTGKAEDDIRNKLQGTRSGRKSHTRAARYLRHSWYPRHYRNRREYSTINCHLLNPKMKSDSEHCDMIIKALKQTYPEEYKTLEKPVLVPGSAEEKEFIENILRLLAKHKVSEGNVKKNKAPFPSYSEVKTFVSEVKAPENNQNSNTSKDLSNNGILNNGSIPRFYSTNDQFKIDKPPEISPFIPFPYVPPKQTSKENINKKFEAPYQSFSEVCTNMQVNGPIGDNFIKSKRVNSKHYCTTVPEIEVKKKPPCKNPFTQPECDYVKTIKKKEENKKKKHCPKDKKCEPDSNKIINKVKNWFNTCKPESTNITVCRSPIDVDGRETYVVEVNDFVEIPENKPQSNIIEVASSAPNNATNIIPSYKTKSKMVPFRKVTYQALENKYCHLPEMTDGIQVLTKNIPDFSSINEELNPENVLLDEAKNSVSKFKYVKDAVEFSAKSIQINEVRKELPLFETKMEMSRNKIKEILEKPKDKEISKVNVVKKDFIMKSKNVDNISLNSNKIQNQVKPQMYYNPINKFQFTANKPEVKDEIKKQTVVQMSPGCDTTKDEACNKQEKDKCPPKKKCRPIKKRKPPKCDDAKGNKSRTCSSVGSLKPVEKLVYSVNPSVSNTQSSTKYLKTQSPKINLKNNTNNYINIKPKIEILANQEASAINKCNDEPFKLKPQFWKK